MSTLTKTTKRLPILITDVTALLKSVSASIWHLQKGEDGTTIRCTLSGKQLRLLVPPPSAKTAVQVEEEKNSALHVVQDMTSLQAWLQQISD